MSESVTATGSTRIWDLPLRLFHWLLVALIAFSWWSGEEHYMEWHRLSGYGILALLVFRLWWGFTGSRTARFSQFVRGPAAVLAYAKTLFSSARHTADGHNPLGGWSVIAMLLAIAAMVVAGLFAVDVDGWESGPLAYWVSFEQGRSAAEFHETVFNVIMALITGPRAKSAEEAVEDARWSPAMALIGIVIAAAVAWFVSTGFRF